MLKELNPSEKVRKRIDEHIKRLEGFVKMAMVVISDLRQEVQHALHFYFGSPKMVSAENPSWHTSPHWKAAGQRHFSQ
jgi:hypothetical protein